MAADPIQAAKERLSQFVATHGSECNPDIPVVLTELSRLEGESERLRAAAQALVDAPLTNTNALVEAKQLARSALLSKDSEEPARIAEIAKSEACQGDDGVICEGDCACKRKARPKRGDTRIRDGKVLRFVELDDKGEVWEILDDGRPDPVIPEPPFPIGAATNCKRVGWTYFFKGKRRDECPFPVARRDLELGYEEGWDAARATVGEKS